MSFEKGMKMKRRSYRPADLAEIERLFLEKTAEILNLDLSDPLLAPRGFDMGKADDNGEPCVLIMGLNPAGNESDADREANLSKTDFPLQRLPHREVLSHIYTLYA